MSAEGGSEKELVTGIECDSAPLSEGGPHVVFSHDGKQLLWQCQTPDLQDPFGITFRVRVGVWDLLPATPRFRELEAVAALDVVMDSAASWSADDSLVAFACIERFSQIDRGDRFFQDAILAGRSVLAVVNVHDGSVRLHEVGQIVVRSKASFLRGLWVWRVAWAPHGRRIAVLVYREPPTVSGGRRDTMQGQGIFLSQHWEDLVSYLVSGALSLEKMVAGMDLQIMEASAKGETRALVTAETLSDFVIVIGWSADGKRIFTMGRDTIREWDVSSLECVRPVHLLLDDSAFGLGDMSVLPVRAGAGSQLLLKTASGVKRVLDSRASLDAMTTHSQAIGLAELTSFYSVRDGPTECAATL